MVYYVITMKLSQFEAQHWKQNEIAFTLWLVHLTS